MYFEHFGLSRSPFSSLPSPDALFWGPGHREGLAALEWGLDEPSGFTLLTGEVGTGKTTLIAALMAKCGETRRIVRIWNPHLGFDEILRDGLKQLGLEPSGSGQSGLLDELIHACELQRVVMIFDEAQELGGAVLEDLRLLSNALSHQERAVQIILVGQPELLTRLADHSLRQLNQRIGARAKLPALGAGEVLAYADCRIRDAGGSLDRVFVRAGLRALTRLSHGIPRRINILCHNAMMIAHLDGADRIDARHVKQAAREYDEPVPRADRSTWPRWRALRLTELRWFGAVAALVGVLWVAFPLVRGSRVPEAQTPTALSRPPRLLQSDSSARSKTSVASAEARPHNVGDDHKQAAADATAVLAVLSAVASAPKASAPTITPAVTPVSANEPRGTTAPEPPANSGKQSEVIVRAGDSLSTIAQKRLGSIHYLQRLVEANPDIRDPNLIYAGQKIRLGWK